jgi:hypothetical protein
MKCPEVDCIGGKDCPCRIKIIDDSCHACGKRKDTIDKYGCMGSIDPIEKPVGCLKSPTTKAIK